MRKLVIAVMAMLVPFTAWTAGCRQDSRQAAFPKGPEVKTLARASTVEEVQPTVPMIPAPIDPEVMQSPDQPTFARIRSVQDREERLAGQYGNTPGLFVLPAEENDLATLMGPVMTPPSPAMPMSSPIYEPLRVIPIGNPGEEPLPEPIPVSALASAPASAPAPMTEFWSRPVTPMTSAYGFTPPPVDVSAMAPPAAAVPIQQPPASAPTLSPGLDADPMFMPESIPGIFTGGEEGPTAFIAPKTIVEPAGDINPPPLLSAGPASFSTVNEPTGAKVVAAKEPLPLWMPSPAALAALPTQPEPGEKIEFSDKVKALLSNDDPKRALAPLAPLGEAKREAMVKIEPLEKLELADLEEPPPLSPALFEVKEGMNPSAEVFMPEPPASGAFSAVPPGVETRDVYRMDFWDNQRAQGVPAKLESLDYEEPKSLPDFGLFGEDILEKKEEKVAASEAPAEIKAPVIPELPAPVEAKKAETPTEPEAPRKVTLVPTKSVPARVLGLEKIDSSVDAPPLKF